MKAKLPRSRCIQRPVMAGVLLTLATALLITPARFTNSIFMPWGPANQSAELSSSESTLRFVTRTEDSNTSSAPSRQQQVHEPQSGNLHPQTTYAQLPLSFEANQGQSERGVKFLSRGRAYTLFLTSDEAVLSLKNSEVRSPKADRFLRTNHLALKTDNKQPLTAKYGEPNDTFLTMRVIGASATAEMRGLDAFPGTSNYFIGRDPKNWRTGVPNYARVQCKGIYPGVDLVYYGNHGQLEYDFVIAPGADPNRIRLMITGQRDYKRRYNVANMSGTGKSLEKSRREWSPRIDSLGNLVISREDGEVRFHKPLIYQPAADHEQMLSAKAQESDSSARTPIQGRYVLQADNEIGFEVAAYDRSRRLVIDPALSYSTYLGGSGNEGGLGIAIDSAGDSYVTGNTTSSNFPTQNPTQGTYAGGPDDVFVTKFDPTGTTLIYSTYLGGSGDDVGEAIAVDSAGNAYVTGYTTSTDFPTMNAFQPANGGASDAFVTKINSTGGLVYSTYLGGKSNDIGYGIAVDSLGHAYVAGQAGSGNFPKKNAFQARLSGSTDAFVTEFNSAGNALVYSTYVGGAGADRAYAIAVDSSGSAYLAGSTNSTNFPTKNPLQAALAGHSDVFVTKLNATGNALVYSTYLGGSGSDSPSGIAVDSAGNAYLAGGTQSSNFPTKNAFQATKAGSHNVFVTKLNPTGTALVFSTYLGGSSYDTGGGIGTDSAGNVYVTGYTLSLNFPTKNPIQAHSAGNWDAFVTEFDNTGGALVYSTYLGGRHIDWAYGLAVDSSGNVYVTGGTQATNFPTKNAFQPANGGGYDAFVVKITP
jgi:hypothetical protein